MNKDLSFFTKRLEELNIVLNKRQECQFLKYFDLLVSWNEKINLTAITDFEDVFIKHFIDSLSFIKAFDSFDDLVKSTEGKTLCDVGTGAGFPGIPLKILLPDLQVTLFDSLDKRIKFLNCVIDELELDGITAIHGRVEDLAKDELFREQFDFATARAVASLPVLSEYCIPFVKKNGFFIAMKSDKANDEISLSDNALKILGGKIENKYEFDLPGTDLFRVIIRIRKCLNTPNKYPRKAGTPSKNPL
ncbi:MAG: 16S rRNA (guanine(527)-N(7))-methyltransferase RsmG [Lachnospiraceae bacterium]|nr:16S rRNA (guanine(527)-N(7))-methyltransferase RsmG [Lachnospiraceae bacterium]